MKNQPMTAITIRMQADVLNDLKHIAPMLGFSGYQPLIRSYVGQGLRKDVKALGIDNISAFIANLKQHGVDDEVIEKALSDTTQPDPNKSVTASTAVANENLCGTRTDHFPHPQP